MASKLQVENELLKEELEQCKELLHKQEVDELTGFYSRNKFFKETQKMLDENPDKRFVFLRADIDRFQLVNSFFGLPEGDRLLQYFAYQLKQLTTFSSHSVLGHIGADVFVVCYQMSTSNLLITMLQRGITALIDGYRDDYKLSVSVGIYNVEDNSMPIDVIYSKAIVASKACKKNYNIYYSVYDENMDESIVRNQLIVNEMHSALAEKQFSIFLQPKCNLASGKIVGAEALVRWMHPDRGLIQPNDFVPVFESNGFISKLDEYVWEQACAYIRSWLDVGIEPIPISVNVSRIDLHNARLTSIFKSMLEKYDIPIEYLHLEITESAYSENPRQIVDAVNGLKEMGFHIEMDDFGTGYSSLNILNEMKLDTLKLDMSFIQEQGSNNGYIVNFIVQLAKQLNLFVVAEGIETAEQVNFLHSIDCDIGQGYFFSKPISKKDFDAYLCSHRRKKVKPTEINNHMLLDFDDVWFPNSNSNSNSKFNFIFNSFIGALALYEVKDSIVTVVRVNDEYLKMLKCSQEDFAVPKDNIFKNIHPDDISMTRKILQQLLTTSNSCKLEIRTSTFGDYGKYVWIRMNAKVAIRLENSVIFLASLEDITEKKYALEKLQETVVPREDFEKQPSIYQTAGTSSIFTVRLREILIFLYANDCFYEMCGIPREYALDHADTVLLETIHPKDASRVMNGLKKITKDRKESFEMELKFLMGDGQIRPMRAKGHVCYDGEYPILDVVVNDINQV